MFRRLILLIGLSITLVQPCASSEPDSLQVGTRVRVTLPSPTAPEGWPKKHTGTVAAMDANTLTLTKGDSTAPLVIQRSNITALEVSTAPNRRAQGALTGMLVGGGIGVASGLAAGDDSGGMFSMTASDKAILAVLVFMPLGAILGALFASGEQWTPISPVPVQMGLLLSAGEGNYAVITVRF